MSAIDKPLGLFVGHFLSFLVMQSSVILQTGVFLDPDSDTPPPPIKNIHLRLITPTICTNPFNFG